VHRVKVAIVGATGYSGEELIRLLARHPSAELVCITSRQRAGEAVGSIFPKFTGLRCSELELSISKPESVIESGAQIAMLALPHGLAAEFAKPLLENRVRVVDLSADFRIKNADVYASFYGHPHPAPELLEQSVYGMPELYREQIRGADLVASPGCYPTSIILPLVPPLKQRLIDAESIISNSLSGISGAGRKAEVEYSFAELNENARAYGLPRHRHLAEIEQELSLAADEKVTLSFAPHLIPVTRGILTTIHANAASGISENQIGAAFRTAYSREPFIRLRGDDAFVQLKDVAGSNFVDIAWRFDPRTERVVLLSAVDNLGKGAAGQAIQNLNLMSGWNETDGLLN
jgi:N-acetyl-gamma-glutamyl-phosphate reductase